MTAAAAVASPVDFETFGDYRVKAPPRADGAFVRPLYPFQGRASADGIHRESGRRPPLPPVHLARLPGGRTARPSSARCWGWRTWCRYYGTHPQLNPLRIVPAGPVLDWGAPQQRAALAGAGTR